MVDAYLLDQATNDHYLLEDASGVYLEDNPAFVVYVNQAFTAANGTAPANLIIGKDPTTGGGATVQSNRVDFVTGTAGGYVYADKVSRTISQDGTTPLSVADILIEVTFTPTADECYPVMAVRNAQATGFDGLMCYQLKLNNNTFSIAREYNHNETVLVTTSWTYTAATAYRVRFQAQGSTLNAWIGTPTLPGSPTLTVDDTWITGPDCAVIDVSPGGDPSSSHAYFDDLYVTNGASSAFQPVIQRRPNQGLIMRGRR